MVNFLSRQQKRQANRKKEKIVVNYEKVVSKLHQGQSNLLKAVLSGEKKYCALMAHRRFGKDFIAFLTILICALKYPGNYYIFAPYFRQAKEIVVDGKTLAGDPLIPSLINRKLLKNPKSPGIVNKSDWSIELYNSSKIFIRGADNPNSNVGVGARGIVYTEAALMKPGFYQYMKPAIDMVISKTGFGIVIFISTPRGKRNWFTQLFVDYFKKLSKNPKLKKMWYVDIQKASTSKMWNGSPVVSSDELEKQRLEMTPEMYEQEWECSCSASSIGAWYSSQLDQAYKDKRIGRFGYYEETAERGVEYKGYYWRKSPIYICWDIGKNDHTAIWCFQKNPNNGRIRFIHHYRAKGVGPDHMANYIKKWYKKNEFEYKPLNILPHDGDNEEWISSTRRSQYLNELGLETFTLTKGLLAELKMNRLITQINAIRENFKYVEIDTEGCAEGVIKLSEYIKKYNKMTGEYEDIPDHDANDKASDDADAFRTGMIYYIEYLKDNQKYEAESFIASDINTKGQAITYEDEDYGFNNIEDIDL